MKTKNILNVIFGIAFLFLVMAPVVSAGQTWFYFEDDINVNSMAVNLGDQVNLIVTAASHNGVPVSSEEISVISTGPLMTWNQPGDQFGTTYVWSNGGNPYTLNTNVLGIGTHTLRFSATTNTGVEYSDLTLIVNAVDNTAPVISLTGANPQTITVGTAYTELGATASDNVDTPATLLANMVIDASTVDTNTIGSYSVTYDVTDTAGNAATQVIRTVDIVVSVDTTLPVVTISAPIAGTYLSDAPTQIDFTASDTNLNQCWYTVDAGVTNISTSCTSSISGLLPVQGTNTWTVYADDLTGNVGSATVTFTVNDLAGPGISAVNPTDNEILDDTDVTLIVTVDETATSVVYSIDGGANITMNETSSFQFESDSLNLNDDEDYTVTYCATDVMGNTACLTIDFSIYEVINSNTGSTVEDNTFTTTDLGGSITIGSTIDLSDDDANNGLSWWQRFINWLSRLFGLEEVY